ncbi:uncharacterized protein DS421_18g627500 [Arachis hypogaea]|nr:uncharacterized protein DS421_18g627500 [Arachis hypogaea]
MNNIRDIAIIRVFIQVTITPFDISASLLATIILIFLRFEAFFTEARRQCNLYSLSLAFEVNGYSRTSIAFKRRRQTEIEQFRAPSFPSCNTMPLFNLIASESAKVCSKVPRFSINK